MELTHFVGFGKVMFTIIPLFIVLMFTLVVVLIIARAVKGTQQWKKNNASPILTVDATVATKRADVQNHYHNTGTNNMPHMSSSTAYYATFEVVSGDRLEFKVPSTEYGMLVENDIGKLTFQGTRYLGFERIRTNSI